MHALEDAYTEIVHRRKNVFSVPYGNAGKSFVSELSRLSVNLLMGQHLRQLH